MPLLTLDILGFLACAAVIVWAGTRLTAYADIIAERTRLGRVWTGMLLLAVATSLPELFNSTSAAVQRLPDIAAGDIAGSNVLNLLILGIIDLFSRGRSCYHGLHRTHARTAGFIVLISALAGGAVLLGARLPALLWLSPLTPLILLLYLLVLRRVGTASEAAVLGARPPGASLRSAVVRYAAFALVVIAAAVLLPRFGSRLADGTGLGHTFVGTLFIALATSLPELVTATAAVRIGAAEMAVGGLLGSNLFNLVIFAIADACYLPGSIFAGVQPTHAVSLGSGIVLAGLFVFVLRRCPERRFLRLTWFGWTAVAVYVANAALLYVLA